MPERRGSTHDVVGVHELMTVDEVASMLRLTSRGIYAMVAARRIPFIKISNRLRFSRSDVVAWVHDNRVPSLGDSR